MSKSALLPTYARSELAFERGQGAYLFTASGERYLDFASGVAVTALGHAHPHLVKALAEQSENCGMCPICIASRDRSGSRRGSARRPSPTMCSSPIPAPRRSKAR